MAGTATLFRTKLGRAVAQLPYVPRALALVWTSARRWASLWILLLILQGLLPAATVYLTRLIVDGLVSAVAAGGDWQSVRAVLPWVILMLVALLLNESLTSVSGWVRDTQAEIVRDHVAALIHDKSVAADLAFYESPDFYDHLHRAREDAAYRPTALVENVGGLLQNSVTLAAMCVVLIPYGWWLPAALLVSTLPALYVVLSYAVRQHQWRHRTTQQQRRAWYYDSMLTSGETAAEVRIFGLAEYFKTAYQNLRARLRSERFQLERNQRLSELVAVLVAFAVTGVAIVRMTLRALRGEITLGSLALFIQAFNQGQRLMRSMLENVGQIYANSLFLGNLFEFLEMKPGVTDPEEPLTAPTPVTEGIRLTNVSFRYPGATRFALRDFSVTIPAGKVVALVGPNGAGKSTLIKLICRFYDPETGTVELDGTDLRRFSLASLRESITVLFQQPVHYNATVAENVRMGNLSIPVHSDSIRDAAQAAGAAEIIERLPDGYDNVLGNTFIGGTELSVGEWQRIALARAFLRRAPLILLDEPTSAMDSWAEADWMDRFHSLAAGRTVVIITHRFSTAMRADLIHVIEDGRVVESGRHDELLAGAGRYAQGWSAQMQSGR